MMIIERASEEDFEHICAMDETGIRARGQREIIARSLARDRVYVARADGKVRGFLILEQSFYGNGFISLLLVQEQWRRQGVATTPMRNAERDCPTAKIFTSTNESNIPMRCLCERIGYVSTGRIENLDEGDPEIVYFKSLADAPGPGADVVDDE
ncbi:MAG: GNAT family N-acetyltransferase [Candidatus Binataceae bacterium]